MAHDKRTSDLIKELNLLDECDTIEAKEISGEQIGSTVYESICAFSNEPGLGGGIIFLGLRRDETQLFPFYEVVGVKHPDKLQSDIVSACQNKFNMPVRPTIKRDSVNGKVVIRIDVDELQAAQKPLYLKNLGLPRGAFRRIGSATVHSTHEDLTALFQDGVSGTYDAHVVPNSRPEDIDQDAVRQYRQYIAEHRPSSEILRWKDSDLLVNKTSLIPLENKMRATATGILTFGRSASIRRFFPQVRADYVRVPGKQWVADPDNRFTSLDMRGPIITLIDRIISAISDDLPTRFQIESGAGRRSDTTVIPHKAIREAVVNALMHRNYKVARPVQIIRYSNRLVIENPGHSLKAQEQFDKPGSIARNPHIAAILHETQFAETKGSGMRVMRQELQKAGLSVPTFESDRENDIFRVTFLFHHLLDKSAWEWLGKFKEHSLSEDLLRALVFVKETNQISNLAFRDITGLDTLGASVGLRKLSKIGLLEKQGSGANTYYKASQAMLDEIGQTVSDASPVSLQVGLQGSLQDSGLSKNERIALIDAKLPLALRRRLVHLRLGKRTEPEEMREIIVEVCRNLSLSKEQIAIVVNRNSAFLAQNYLSPLVKEGRLQLAIPQSPSHPDQKYEVKGGKGSK